MRFPDGTHRVTGSAGFVYEKNAFNFQLLKKAGAISIFRTLQKGETVSLLFWVRYALPGTLLILSVIRTSGRLCQL